MSRRFIGSVILVAVFLSLPALTSTPALAQKKKAGEGAKAKKVDAIDSGKFAAGEFIGLLKTTPGSDRMFNLEAEQTKIVPVGKGGNKPVAGKGNNTNHLQQLQQRIVHDQAKIQNAKSPQERQKAMQDLAKVQSDYQNALNKANAAVAKVPATKIEKVKTLIEFQASETMKVRTMILAEEFDEKGNPKKYTKEELATLKGKDKNLPGYESSLEKLETGQKIRVVLAAVPKKPVAKDKDAEKDAPENDQADKKKQVKLIVILEESKGTPAKGKGKEKKKK